MIKKVKKLRKKLIKMEANPCSVMESDMNLLLSELNEIKDIVPAHLYNGVINGFEFAKRNMLGKNISRRRNNEYISVGLYDIFCCLDDLLLEE